MRGEEKDGERMRGEGNERGEERGRDKIYVRVEE